MFSFLLKIRNQSENNKKKFLILFTIITMCLVWFVWYFLSGVVVGNIKYVARDYQKTSGIGLILNTFESFFTDTQRGFVDIKDNLISGVKK